LVADLGSQPPEVEVVGEVEFGKGVGPAQAGCPACGAEIALHDAIAIELVEPKDIDVEVA